jgi:cytochrome P450
MWIRFSLRQEENLRVEYEPLGGPWHADPYPTYRALREHAPVHLSPTSGCFCLSRYDDAVFALRNPELFSSRAMQTMLNPVENGSPWQRLLAVAEFLAMTRINPIRLQKTANLITSDPPRHDTMRAVVSRGFTPRRIRVWEERARQITAGCLRKLQGGAPFDVVRDLAIPLPVTIIAELLGVAPERQLEFKHWSDAIISSSTGSRRAHGMDRAVLRTLSALYRYLREVIAARRSRPGDDLVSVIVSGQAGEATLSDLEVFQFVVLLLVAGNETTTNLIGNAVQALLDHPEQLELVSENPALIPQLVEETLRFDPPIQLLFRTAQRDTEIAGVRIPKGAVIAPLIGAANRDERRFPDGDRFDVTRDATGHLAFGFGTHFCLGASLARLEATAALGALVPKLSQLMRADAERPRVDSFLVRGLTRLVLVPAKCADKPKNEA